MFYSNFFSIPLTNVLGSFDISPRLFLCLSKTKHFGETANRLTIRRYVCLADRWLWLPSQYFYISWRSYDVCLVKCTHNGNIHYFMISLYYYIKSTTLIIVSAILDDIFKFLIQLSLNISLFFSHTGLQLSIIYFHNCCTLCCFSESSFFDVMLSNLILIENTVKTRLN